MNMSDSDFANAAGDMDQDIAGSPVRCNAQQSLGQQAQRLASEISRNVIREVAHALASK